MTKEIAKLSRMDRVKEIPIDEKVKASFSLKQYLLGKLQAIQANRTIIQQATLDRKREEVLNAYKKSVGFDAVIEKMEKARKEAEEANESLLKIGLDSDGHLLNLSNKSRSGEKGTFVFIDSYNTKPITAAAYNEIKKTKKLLKAVEGEMEVFSQYDQLETRLMMASTIGECMAIVNAITDQDIFSPEKVVRALEEKTNE